MRANSVSSTNSSKRGGCGLALRLYCEVTEFIAAFNAAGHSKSGSKCSLKTCVVFHEICSLRAAVAKWTVFAYCVV